MEHTNLPRARSLLAQRMDDFEAAQRLDCRFPESFDEKYVPALNVWLYRGSTIRQAVELVFASALEGNPLT